MSTNEIVSIILALIGGSFFLYAAFKSGEVHLTEDFDK